MKNMIRWAQVQPKETPEPYDWRFVIIESMKLVIIGLTAWWVIWALFPMI